MDRLGGAAILIGHGRLAEATRRALAHDGRLVLSTGASLGGVRRTLVEVAGRLPLVMLVSLDAETWRRHGDRLPSLVEDAGGREDVALRIGLLDDLTALGAVAGAGCDLYLDDAGTAFRLCTAVLEGWGDVPAGDRFRQSRLDETVASVLAPGHVPGPRPAAVPATEAMRRRDGAIASHGSRPEWKTGRLASLEEEVGVKKQAPS